MALLLDVANPFFRVCIIEDTVFLRKVAEKLISNKFANGGYGNILQLEVDSVTSYTELLTVHAKRIQEGYYNVILVDNDLNAYPDAKDQERCIEGVEFVANLVRKAATATCLIMNSSNNRELVLRNPELEQIYHMVPPGGKNQPEAFSEINALFLKQALVIDPLFESSIEGTPSTSRRFSPSSSHSSFGEVRTDGSSPSVSPLPPHFGVIQGNSPEELDAVETIQPNMNQLHLA